MRQTEQQIVSRIEIAEELRDMADQIEAGSIRVGDAVVAIPDTQIEFEIELSEEPERTKLEFELKWHMPGI